ncbi:MAG: hypothetical protein ABJC05_08760, partial [Pyrinomonadaceae bacterium]
MKRFLPFIIIGVVLLGAAGGGWMVLHARRGTSASPEVSSVATAPTKSPAAAKTKPPTGKF